MGRFGAPLGWLFVRRVEGLGCIVGYSIDVSLGASLMRCDRQLWCAVRGGFGVLFGAALLLCMGGISAPHGRLRYATWGA